MNKGKDMEGVGLDLEAPGITKTKVEMPNLPKPLTLEEKKYMLAVERGDLANVRRVLQLAHRRRHINVNCVDSLGRGALSLAIDGENLQMVELLVVMGVETRDALLHSINVEFVEAVELLLEHEELIHRANELYSWEKMDWNTATFTPDITPLILAAHRNNYEIIKILLDRGATLPMPHDVKCSCDECIRESSEDSLRHSISRINMYKALASPSLIALSSNDPLLTAFQLSWELRNLAFAEQESKSQYLELRRQCQQFAVDLLDRSRSSLELAIILNHDPDNPPYEDGEPMKLARLELAINYKQKKFVAHPNIQQLLAAIWYEGLPGFRRKSVVGRLLDVLIVALLFPLYCVLYMIAPHTNTGKLMRKPFMKFLIHASSYLFFLLILILVSQRAEVQIIQLLGTTSMRRNLEEQLRRQRGNGPTPLEWIVVVYVLGFIWEETQEVFAEGIRSYLRNMWNFIDFTRNSLYVAVCILRVAAYIQQSTEIAQNPATAYIPREDWNDFDPQLIAEGLFAAANVFSALKLVHLFSINPHLGPLQISLGRMVIDIVKFFFIYSLVLFAFACGLNQLLWYFSDMERKKCYHLDGGRPDWDNRSDSCMKWRYFANLFESSQSLFWASFGGVGIDSFQLVGIKTYTRFWGLLMFGSYSVINVIVLLNLLIAMMSNSYAIIDEHSDTEWKFARTRLWMSYFEESATLPPPFNIFPTPKHALKLLGLRKKDKLRRMSTKRKERQEKERDYRYSAVMRALVWRYVSARHRQAEENPVTEDDINEVKGEVSAMKCEILEVLHRNGMDVSSADIKEKTILGKKNRIWERRLMKDFQVAPIAAEEEMDKLISEPPPENEDSLARFRRIAKLAVLHSSSHKWGQVVHGICEASQIGRCNSRESFKKQQNLQKAMEHARKLVSRSPAPGSSPICVSPIPLPETATENIMKLLKDLDHIPERNSDSDESIHKAGNSGLFLQVQKAQRSKTPTPLNTLLKSKGKSDEESHRPSVTAHEEKEAASPYVEPSQQAPKCKQDDTSTEKVLPGQETAAFSNIAPPEALNDSTAPTMTSGTEDTVSTSTAVYAAGMQYTTCTVLTSTSRDTEAPNDAVVCTAPAPISETTPTTVPDLLPTISTIPTSSYISSKFHGASDQHADVLGRSIPKDDPSPLISTQTLGGDSPPKVVKRKPPISGTCPEQMQLLSTTTEIPPETNMTCIPLLPPPIQPPTKVTQEKRESKESKTKTLIGTKEKENNSNVAKKSSLPEFELTLANSENSTNDAESVASSSREQLIAAPHSSPAPLRPIKRIEDVNTIKRQPKAGWL